MSSQEKAVAAALFNTYSEHDADRFHLQNRFFLDESYAKRIEHLEAHTRRFGCSCFAKSSSFEEIELYCKAE